MKFLYKSLFGLLPERIISIVVSSEQIRVIFQTILILVFFTWVILWKSHNNVSFVLRRSFTLLARRSSLLVSVLEKHEAGSPNTHRSHPCYSSRDVKQRNTRISNCLESLLTSFVVALIPWKKTSNVTRWRRHVSVKYSRQNDVIIFEQKYSKQIRTNTHAMFLS